jgi:hypothetical protein
MPAWPALSRLAWALCTIQGPSPSTSKTSIVTTRPCIKGELASNRHGANRLVHITTAAGIELPATFEPFAVSTETLALAAIGDGAPAGHLLRTALTMDCYEHAFCTPLLSNWDNHDTWVECGKFNAYGRANSTWKKMWSQYGQPAPDPATDDALKDYMNRRKLGILGTT